MAALGENPWLPIGRKEWWQPWQVVPLAQPFGSSQPAQSASRNAQGQGNPWAEAAAYQSRVPPPHTRALHARLASCAWIDGLWPLFRRADLSPSSQCALLLPCPSSEVQISSVLWKPRSPRGGRHFPLMGRGPGDAGIALGCGLPSAAKALLPLRGNHAAGDTSWRRVVSVARASGHCGETEVFLFVVNATATEQDPRSSLFTKTCEETPPGCLGLPH